MGRKISGFAGFPDPARPGEGAPRFAETPPERSFCSASGRGGLAGKRHSPQDSSAKSRARPRRYASPASEGGGPDKNRGGGGAAPVPVAGRASPQGGTSGGPKHPHPLRFAPGLPPLKRGKDIHCGVKAFCRGIPWNFSAKWHRRNPPPPRGEAGGGARGGVVRRRADVQPRKCSGRCIPLPPTPSPKGRGDSLRCRPDRSEWTPAGRSSGVDRDQFKRQKSACQGKK